MTTFGSPSMNRSEGLTQPPLGPWRFARAAIELRSPIVLPAGGIGEAGLAGERHRLGERLIVVIEPVLPQAGVFFERVILGDVGPGGLHARVVLREPGVDHALEAGVGHARIGAEPTVGVVSCDTRAAVGGRVNEAAVVHLPRPCLVVELALEVLARETKTSARFSAGSSSGSPVSRRAWIMNAVFERSGRLFLPP